MTQHTVQQTAKQHSNRVVVNPGQTHHSGTSTLESLADAIRYPNTTVSRMRISGLGDGGAAPAAIACATSSSRAATTSAPFVGSLCVLCVCSFVSLHAFFECVVVCMQVMKVREDICGKQGFKTLQKQAGRTCS